MNPARNHSNDCVLCSSTRNSLALLGFMVHSYWTSLQNGSSIQKEVSTFDLANLIVFCWGNDTSWLSTHMQGQEITLSRVGARSFLMDGIHHHSEGRTLNTFSSASILPHQCITEDSFSVTRVYNSRLKRICPPHQECRACVCHPGVSFTFWQDSCYPVALH